MRKKTTDIFKKEIFELVGKEYVVLGEYSGTHIKVEMLHSTCGDEFEMHPANFLRGQRCPLCSGRKKKTTKIFKKEVYDLVKDEYSVLGEYKNTDSHIKMKHNTCGYEYVVTPYQFVTRGNRCTLCSGYMKKTTEKFIAQVYDLESDKYVVGSEYINDYTHVTMKHKECGHTYEVSPSNFLRGKRCPKCKSSKGEIKIAKWLDLNLIKYEAQYKFDDCKNELPLSFDFAIFNEQNNLVCLIEFDGGQHFKPIKHFGGENGFIKTKFRDNIKNTYCKKNDITLLRIPYWDLNNVEEILASELTSN